jgi:hypothetical protein
VHRYFAEECGRPGRVNSGMCNRERRSRSLDTPLAVYIVLGIHPGTPVDLTEGGSRAWRRRRGRARRKIAAAAVTQLVVRVVLVHDRQSLERQG